MRYKREDNSLGDVMFDIYKIIDKLKEKRKLFVSEADFQLELAWIIKEEYSNAKVRLEYSPSFDPNMHIDILVVINDKWIPIELKYKTKGCIKVVDEEEYHLKNHGAKDVNCYLYLKDIQRIERIKEKINNFEKGYTIFITNEMSYTKEPKTDNCIYKDFSLHNGTTKQGVLNWSENAGEGTKKNCEKPIVFKNKYEMLWKDYSKIDVSNTGEFKVLVNEIKKD